MALVSVVACADYELNGVRAAVTAAVDLLGGIVRFVQPGMRVLLKPNLLMATDLERAVTTHPAVVRVMAELVRGAGGEVLIGDSPAGPLHAYHRVWSASGMAEVAHQTGARLIPFESVAWKQVQGRDYFIARPVTEVDLVINLPKLKTHTLTRYTGAVKNLFGVVPGTRKRELHLHAPGGREFAEVLVDVLELVRPGLTLMDGVIGQEGNGPGPGGTPRPYGCILASTDPVALDCVATQAMGYRQGEVWHLAQAATRHLGEADPARIRVEGDGRALDFGSVDIPSERWYSRMPAWLSAPIERIVQVRPHLDTTACIGCGACVEVCPRQIITLEEAGQPPRFDLEQCIGCLCCAEVCPQGAITPRRNWAARLIRIGE